MKDCVLFFLKIMLVIWWIILGIVITCAAVYAEDGYRALLALFMMTIWVSLSGTAIYWSNKDYMGRRGKDE